MMSLNQVCPYCDITKINKDIVSVDHLLPKASFPVLSIFPDNLIVVCKACNEVIKGETIYLPIAHPCYEEVSRHFTFVIKENNNNKFTIEIATNSKNSKLINQKIYNFIKLFKIIDRYEKYMTAELQDYRTAVRTPNKCVFIELGQLTLLPPNLLLKRLFHSKFQPCFSY
ncbi:HNH endonuclease [Paenibacillus polymyxa]|uniref:HNH endonuclease n=1 Tax=Paenibacillus polymyxa TaxID=1406 RepID=UPI0023F8E202|nr:HNH endonuclease [Paenibacillus polymyxa]